MNTIINSTCQHRNYQARNYQGRICQGRLRQLGFTLVELMIVVAIVGILAAVGFPMYTSAIKKGDRADAVDSILKEQGRLEEYYLANDTYVGAAPFSATSERNKYDMTFSNLTAYSYTINATRNPATDDPECTSLTLDQTGKKSGTGTAPTECWPN